MQRTPTSVVVALLTTLSALRAQDNPPVFDSSAVEHLPWRHLGPANPMGRMTDIAVHDDRQSTWFVGTAGGGVWRTENGGTTWECVFNEGGTVSIGDVAIAPSDPDVIYVGTGEENARNSVQWGDGVYKSTDGGETWTHCGLRETFQIGHVEVHPTNPNIVYVAALGRLWGENEERGVFRSKDGGGTWERVLHLDDRTGCVDVRLHPGDPMTVFACMYERKRDRFDGNDPVVRFGEQYRQWSAAFDAGYAAALGKPLITLHPSAHIHALKEVDAAAMAVAETPDQVIEILSYVTTKT